jgi:hypothetical protein
MRIDYGQDPVLGHLLDSDVGQRGKGGGRDGGREDGVRGGLRDWLGEEDG